MKRPSMLAMPYTTVKMMGAMTIRVAERLHLLA
jgi:hypothetical protein